MLTPLIWCHFLLFRSSFFFKITGISAYHSLMCCLYYKKTVQVDCNSCIWLWLDDHVTRVLSFYLFKMNRSTQFVEVRDTGWFFLLPSGFPGGGKLQGGGAWTVSHLLVESAAASFPASPDTADSLCSGLGGLSNPQPQLFGGSQSQTR